MKQRIVIYHGGCWDGFCARWAFQRQFGDDADYFAATYGQPMRPETKDRNVFMVDFSYKRDEMMEIGKQANLLVVLDHHKSAFKELDGVEDELRVMHQKEATQVIFDMEKSGGRLAWEYVNGVHPQGIVPWLVSYTEDRDLWRHSLPFSREVNAYIRSFPLEFKQWQDWFDYEEPPTWFVNEGKAIMRREAQIVDQHVSHANKIRIGQYVMPAVNATVLFSEIAGTLAERSESGLGAAYFLRSDGKYTYSLRSRGEIDVSELARSQGGGGHPGAAGFESYFPPVFVE